MGNWNVTPLGKGCFEFNFNIAADMRNALAHGSINLKPGILRFFCWSHDFNTQSQVQTHAQVWIRLMHLPQEYWRDQTLLEIASEVGTPLLVDAATKSRLFGIYARILVDVDISGKLFNSVLVEREEFSFLVEVQYERHSLFCSHCKNLGHSIQQCRKLNVRNDKEPVDQSKRLGFKQAPKFKNMTHSADLIGQGAPFIPIAQQGNLIASVGQDCLDD